MLKRDKATGRLLKQPVKIGDKVICYGKNKHQPYGCRQMTAYTVVATENSKEHNRTSFGIVYPLDGMKTSDRFGFFIIDDDGHKIFCRMGVDCFGITWEELPDGV